MKRVLLGVVLVSLLVAGAVGPATVAGVQTGAQTTGGPTDGPIDGSPGVSASLQQGQCSFPVTATDATGTEVTIEEEPQRVVALGASSAQIMWELDAQEKVVGMPVDSTTAYLDGSQSRTDTFQADQFTVATERVVGLEPDLVLAPDIIPNETVEQLRGAGITVYKFGFATSLGDVNEEVKRTGRLVGACGPASETVEDTDAQVSAIRNAVAGEDRPRVLYGADLSAGYVAGNGTFIHQVVETAGGDDVAAKAGIQGYQQINPETVAQRDPEWIIVSDASTIPDGEPWASTTAVQEDQIIEVNSNLIGQPAPRVVRPMTAIARQLHPDAMAQANATSTAEPAADGGQTASAGTDSGTDGGTAAEATAEGTSAEVTAVETAVAQGSTTREEGAVTVNDATDTNSGGTGTETSSGNGPGFGVVAAAIALLATVLLARRRP